MKVEQSRKAGLLLAAGILLVSVILSYSFSSGKQALIGAGILLASLVLWSSEALPMSITTMLMICVLSFTNIMTFHESIASIGVNTSLFIMASSGITIAVGESILPNLLTRFIISKSAGNSKRLVMGIGFLIAVCSAFMSSLATCALFNGILLPMLTKNKRVPGKSNLGKCLMMAIPACAGIGGFMSPAGTPANILLLEILSDNNIPVSFGQWCLVGFPVGFIAVGLFLFSVIQFFPPEPLVLPEASVPAGKDILRSDDKKTIVIVGCVIAFWFASGWIPSINTTLIAVVGLSIMFFPGFELLNWKKFADGVNWDLVITMGTVSVLMTGIAKTGFMSSISAGIMNGIVQFPLLLSLMILSLAICLIRSFIPTTTAVVALLAPMLIEASFSLHIGILNLLLMLAFWTASALLIVYTEPIYLITYGNRYYTGKDLFKAGAIPCLILSVVTATMIPWITSLCQLGYYSGSYILP